MHERGISSLAVARNLYFGLGNNEHSILERGIIDVLPIDRRHARIRKGQSEWACSSELMKREARYVEANDPLAAQAHLIQAQDTQLRTRIAVALRERRERVTDAIRLKQGRMGHKHLRTR